MVKIKSRRDSVPPPLDPHVSEGTWEVDDPDEGAELDPVDLDDGPLPPTSEPEFEYYHENWVIQGKQP